MRIAMFTDVFYPEISGMTDAIVGSVEELVKLGHSVDIYAPKYPKKDFQLYGVSTNELDLGSQVKIHRFRSVYYPTATNQGRMVIPTCFRWLWMLKNKPDIIHVHDIFGAGFEGMIASKFLRVPLVGTNHTPITEFMKYSPVHSRLTDVISLHFVSWFYNRCSFVTAPCNIILEEMRHYGLKRPSRALSNPIDLENFFPVTEEEKQKIKKEFGLSNFTVLYTGRLADEKHIDVVIRAVAKLQEKIPNINFAITGHGAAQESLQKLAEELGIGDQVKFFGTLPTLEHAQIYKAVEAFAIASTAEMQSLSMMKAMATAVPVIGVNAWALPEYINKDNGFVVEIGDFEGIAGKLLYLFENPEMQKQLGMGGLNLVSGFATAKIAAIWDEIYKKSLENHKK